MSAQKGTLSRKTPSVLTMDSHPTLNYYIAGTEIDQQSVISLYQFNQTRELVNYYTGNHSKITKCRFDNFGSSFSACDTKGNMYTWKFDASVQSLHPVRSLPCHSTIANDVVYLDSSSLIATAGLALNFDNVCLWDTLMPVQRSKVKGKYFHCLERLTKGFQVNETGSHSISFDKDRRLLFCGGKKGDISLFLS